MKKIFFIAVLSMTTVSFLFSGEKQKNKLKKSSSVKKYVREYEPMNRGFGSVSASASKIPNYNNSRNSSFFALVDSSTNGYGKISSTTRPLHVDADGNWAIAYRQYAGLGANASAGQLGFAESEDGQDWRVINNINSNGNPPWGGGGVGGGGSAQARFPSAVGSSERPYAIWNEYTDIFPAGCNGFVNIPYTAAVADIDHYGGRPYYAYDDEWDGGLFQPPAEIDPDWTSGCKDLWNGSAAMSFSEDLGMDIAVVTYTDWTRNNSYVFTTEVSDDSGLQVFGGEQVLFDETSGACLAPYFIDPADGTLSGYNGNQLVSMNDSGQGVIGLVGLFNGCDGTDPTSTSTYSPNCNHTPIFKMTDDHGMTWSGDSNVCGNDGSGGVYYIPDNVFDSIEASLTQPDPETGNVLDFECSESYVESWEGVWAFYEYDIKVDADGNPHFLLLIYPEGIDAGDATNTDGTSSFWYTENMGWYHFTIDKDYLESPGQVNSATGWNWSMVVRGDESGYWGTNDADGSISNDMMASLSFDRDGSDIVWVTANLMTDTCGELFDDYDTEDPCDDTYSYPETSQDIYIIKSVDNGSTWYNPYNATDSKDDPLDYPEEWGVDADGNPQCPTDMGIEFSWCGPEESFPHAAHFSTEDEVYYSFQMPNWGASLDLTTTANHYDFLNRVYVATTELITDSADPYPEDCSILCNDTGDANGDNSVDIFDILKIINHIFSTALIDPVVDPADFCAADINENGTLEISDIIPIVNIILAGDGRLDDAYDVNIFKTENTLEMDSNDGFVSIVEIDITHGEDVDLDSFKFNVSGENQIAVPSTKGNKSTIIMILPSDGVLFELNSEDGFLVESAVAYNSSRKISSTVVDHFALMDIYPNPFNPTATISFDLNISGDVNVAIYNIMGQKVATLVDEYKQSGSYQVQWNGVNELGSEMASGIYMVKLVSDKGTLTNKITLLK